MAADRPRTPRGFTEDTNATPLVHITEGVKNGPKRPCLVMVAGPRLGEIFPIEGELLIGRDPQAALRLPDDESVSRKHARVTALPVEGGGALITDLGSANGTFVDGEKVDESVLKEGAKIRVGQTNVLKFARYDTIEESAQRQLLESALRDGMTRAFNRRYFMQRLGAELRFAERHSQTVALLMLDLDHFKQLNDDCGHPSGDAALEKLVEVLDGGLRAEDVLARYGGEEFAILLRNISADNAMALAERLRKTVADTHFGPFGKESAPRQMTISIGVATFPDGDAKGDAAVAQLVARADAALYRAKNSGRNKTSR
ncbi:MAG TPA: GGDEF domain-containing protein [Polyangia bacterium]|nr:GGDEF domain-containing protein [Polyangia bacterium]